MKESLEQQLTEAYESYSDVIYRLCLYKTSNGEQAEDLVQEVFIRFWDYLSKGGEIVNIKSFLYQIARNLIIDYYRKKKAESLDELQEDGFQLSGNDHEDIINQSEKNIAIGIINQLEEKYRDVVYLRLVEEMTMKEIGQTLAITANNVTVRFHRGMKQVELFIKKYENRSKTI
ncbi:sigma-70 family RNA polymerase sigma factor [Candidatus Azambacteria bacterium]|nr:sigma-70 family RNA polymerase sigma factor [Candidatus Azambacteria bacterium]